MRCHEMRCDCLGNVLIDTNMIPFGTRHELCHCLDKLSTASQFVEMRSEHNLHRISSQVSGPATWRMRNVCVRNICCVCVRVCGVVSLSGHSCFPNECDVISQQLSCPKSLFDIRICVFQCVRASACACVCVYTKI